MQQLDFFSLLDDNSSNEIQRDTKQKQTKKHNRRGRPKSITYELIFEIKKELSLKKRKLSNNQIIEKYNISRSAFYRIQKGHYNKFFEQEIQKNIATVSLDFTD